MPQSVRCKEYSSLCSPNQCSIQATKTNCTLACYKIIQPNPDSELIQPNQGAPFQYQLCFDCVQQRYNNDDCGTCCIKSSDMFILVIHLLALEDQGGASADFCQTALPSQNFHFFADTETIVRGPCLTFAISSGEGAHQVPNILLVQRSAQNVNLQQNL